jgi:type I restriction enzyme S subunit
MKDNWVTKQIIEFGEVISGGTPSTTIEEFWNGDIVWITPADLSKKQFPEINTSGKKITLEGLKSSSANIIPAGSIVMSSRAPIGYFAVPSVDFSTNQGCKSVNINSENDALFHYYNFLYNVEVFKRRGEGTTFAEISKKEVEKLSFTFPEPLPQQQKIAKILSTVDNVIEKTESAISKYQAIKQGLMHDLFTRGIDVTTGKLRPTPQEAPELYKESALGLIPREWEVEELVNLTKLVTDGAHFSPIPQEKGLPIGNVKDMRDSNFDYDKCTKILPEVFKLLVRQNCSPIKGDVLLSKDGTIGKVIHFEDDREIVLLSSIAIIRVNELIDSRYLSWALQSEYFDKALYALLSGSALKRITLKDILKIRLPFSKDIEEQIQIAARLEKIKDKIQTEQQALAKYQQLKAGLLQDLLTGKVEVSVEVEVETLN